MYVGSCKLLLPYGTHGNAPLASIKSSFLVTVCCDCIEATHRDRLDFHPLRCLQKKCNSYATNIQRSILVKQLTTSWCWNASPLTKLCDLRCRKSIKSVSCCSNSNKIAPVFRYRNVRSPTADPSHLFGPIYQPVLQLD